jgi:hypothetical protein
LSKTSKRPIRVEEGEEFVKYKYVTTADGVTKRKKVIKKTITKIKKLTEE